ncbi:UvrD-helicase domain-containing protein [Bacillus cereus]|uniref:UvrD-helicase domain-containing protein n=1 Tax=Bacillus cereus TaxID=1396 RepID=UPI000C281A7F|nr:UvrD-helicase domain-containing protein [Bacillus cereus]
MASGLDLSQQFTLINAPAGSGKTTAVSNTVRKLLRQSNKKVLCITYTNRAAEQLREKIDSERVEVGTIHSFIGNFMVPFFRIKSVIEYFVQFYCSEIKKIIEGKDERSLIKLEKYRERNNLEIDFVVTEKVVLENISYIKYGETQFSSFLYGGLSHDDLLTFSRAVFEKFPKLNMALAQKYSFVFIDEYQDTSSAILDLFYTACLNNETRLVLLGDEMQQIYKERVEDFQEVINRNFIRENTLKSNWRSQANIVSVLNNIYFDSLYSQYAEKPAGNKAKIHVVNDLIDINLESDTLQLVLYNSELFKEIEAFNLYKVYNKIYAYHDKYSAKEILLNSNRDNPDDLIVLLIFIIEISELFDKQRFIQLIQKIDEFKFANKEIWRIKNHSDKVKVADQLNRLSQEVKSNKTLNELLCFLQEIEIIDSTFLEMVISQIEGNTDFRNELFDIRLNEFLNCYKQIKNPTFSTQHAVKGEGYDKVAFKISDGTNNINVRMYAFLKLFSKGLFDYKELMSMNEHAKKNISSLNTTIEKQASNLNAKDFKQFEEPCKKCILEIKKIFIENKGLFLEIFGQDYLSFEGKPNVTNFKKCIKAINKIEGILLAYKLFYVGCSRAKEQLDVYVTNMEIQSFQKEFISKMESIGFEVSIEV